MLRFDSCFQNIFRFRENLRLTWCQVNFRKKKKLYYVNNLSDNQSLTINTYSLY